MTAALNMGASLHTSQAPGFLFPARSKPSHRSVARRGFLGLFSRPQTRPIEVLEDEQGAALREWLEQQGLPPQKVIAAQEAGCGRGLFAVAPISKGSVAVQVPAPLVLTAAAAVQQSAFLSALLQQQQLPAWSVLALWLVEARATSSTHPWGRYLQVLPEQTGSVLEWSDKEVEWLRGSYLHQTAGQIRGAAAASWQEMQPMLAAAEQQGTAAAGVFSQPALMWAFSVLLSRLIRLPGLRDEEALVPWADFLNHDCNAAGCHLDWEAASSAVVLRADRQYQSGEQVFVSYGAKTSGQLLLSYGFLPAPGANPHDGCLLPLQLRGSPAQQQWKLEVLAEHGMPDPQQQPFPLRMEALPQGLLAAAALAAAEPRSQAEAQQLGAQLFGSGAGSAQLTGGSAELHGAALQEVRWQCQRMLDEYPAPLDANKLELAQLRRSREAAGTGSWPSRREQVLQVLVNEQQVLARTTFLLQQQLRQLRRP